MSIDAWFPLVVYYTDLHESALQKPGLVKRILEIYDSADNRRDSSSAWTGDIHNAERIHCDAAFTWITEQVGAHAIEYLKTLGHDLAKIDVYIQRSWPVISEKGQGVG